MFLGGEPDLGFESLRLWILCQSTKWAHLPVAGGWYDQHPLFIDEIMIIFDVYARIQREKNPPPDEERRAAARQYGAMGDGPPIIR